MSNEIRNFAHIDENNYVKEIIVIDASISNPEYFIIEELKMPGFWVECNQDLNNPKAIAGVGSTYDPEEKVFIPYNDQNGWIFNKNLWTWEAPIPNPTTKDASYVWDNEKEDWVFDQELTDQVKEEEQKLLEKGITPEMIEAEIAKNDGTGLESE